MNSGKFAISVHILTLLAAVREEWIPSEYLAESININPVLVRKELINLREHGLIESKEGKSGGSRLKKSPDKITLSAVYEAVRQQDLLGRKINQPNPDCPVGKKINDHLDDLYKESESVLLASLADKTIADFCKKFQI